MATKCGGSLKTYSKKIPSSSSTKFDQIFKNKVNVKTTTTRWGQTTFTAVRRQINNESVNGSEKVCVKKAKIEPVRTQSPDKKQNKFFKSRSTSDVQIKREDESVDLKPKLEAKLDEEAEPNNVQIIPEKHDVPPASSIAANTRSMKHSALSSSALSLLEKQQTLEVEKLIERQKRLLKLKQEEFKKEMQKEIEKDSSQESEVVPDSQTSVKSEPMVEESEPSEVLSDDKLDGVDADASSFSQEIDSSQALQSSCSQETISSSQPEKLIDKNQVGPHSKAAPLPKKKFFSKSGGDKSKKILQLNLKNFFKSEDAANETVVDTANKPTEGEKMGMGDPLDDDSEYIKLQRVRKAHQCHELGETEQFDGDIKFYLSGLESCNTISMRCLSILGLANMCQRAEFRMHLRAHDDMPKTVSALMDAPSNCNLALCTSALLFVYNQDRLTMDIDPNTLSLMLELLETRTDEFSSVEKRHYDKVQELCKAMKAKGHGKYLKLTELTAGRLALEALLGLTSKRAGDWFKEELRTLKGCDFLMDTVISACENEQNLCDEGELNKIDRTLKVVENVTFMHEENQRYFIEFKSGLFIKTCIKLIIFCKSSIITCLESASYLSALLTVLRILNNLTSEFPLGCVAIGSFENTFDLLLEMVFELPSFVVPDSRFELLILLLCLGINLVEYCDSIRESFIQRFYVLQRLIDIFIERTKEAQQTEQQADDLLESHENQPLTEAMQDSLLNQVLAKSGKHMEHCIIAACISLLVGCGIRESHEAVHTIREMLPDSSFDSMVDVLVKLKEFAHLADIMTPSGVQRVERILSVFNSNASNTSTSQDLEASVELPSITALDTSTSFLSDVL